MIPALLALLFAVPQEPVLHKSRVVLRTSKGDLVVALYPEIAPRHVEHFLKLVREEYYEGTRFGHVTKGFILRHAGYVERLRPLTKAQEDIGKIRLPAEFSLQHHVRGAVSMMRDTDDPDSGGVFFAILLGDAPQMDGKYTIFGRVVSGMEVLDALEAVEVGPGFIPKLPLNLHHAFIEGEIRDLPLFVGGAMIVLGLSAFLLSGRVLHRYAGSIGLAVVISGFFIGFVAATPRIVEAGERRETLALIVFVSLLALFKLMNKFESPRA